MVGKNSECPILEALNFLQSFKTKMIGKKFWLFQISYNRFTPKWLEKIWKAQFWFGMPNFGHSNFLTIFLHQNGRKKFGMPNFGRSEFLTIFLYQNGWNKFRVAFQIWLILPPILPNVIFDTIVTDRRSCT